MSGRGPSTYRIGTLAAMAIVLAACGGPQNETGGGSAAGETAAANAAESATLRNREGPAQADTLDLIIARLGTLEGEFVKSGPAASMQFTGDGSLLRSFLSFGDQAVHRLVDCMDRQEPARATYDENPVTLGLMCYAALRLTVYHEPVDESGDLTGEWAGFIDASASREDLIAAQRAWQNVLQDQAYVFYPPDTF